MLGLLRQRSAKPPLPRATVGKAAVAARHGTRRTPHQPPNPHVSALSAS